MLTGLFLFDRVVYYLRGLFLFNRADCYLRGTSVIQQGCLVFNNFLTELSVFFKEDRLFYLTVLSVIQQGCLLSNRAV